MELDTVNEDTDLSLQKRENDTNIKIYCLFKRSAIKLERIFRRYLLALSNASTMILRK